MKEVLTLKEVMENKDLAKHIAEDIDEIPEDTEVTYELWAIGYNADGAVTDTEMFIAEFKDPDAAIEFAEKVTMADIVHQAAEEHDGSAPAENVTYISLEIETVIDEDEDGTSVPQQCGRHRQHFHHYHKQGFCHLFCMYQA